MGSAPKLVDDGVYERWSKSLEFGREVCEKHKTHFSLVEFVILVRGGLEKRITLSLLPGKRGT